MPDNLTKAQKNKTYRCLICGSQIHDCIAYPQRNRKSNGLYFNAIERCSSCGLGRARPYPTQTGLDAFYAKGEYWVEAVSQSRAQTLHEKNQCRHRVRACIPHLKSCSSIRVLDIGAGHGWIASWLHEYLPTGVALYEFIEPDNTRSQEILNRSYPFQVNRVMGMHVIEYDYDLVFANHVVEHVADPVTFISTILRHLKPEGILYAETPNSDYRFKSDVFPHTFFFTREALMALAKTADLECILCETFGNWPLSSNSSLISRLTTLLLRRAYTVCTVIGWDILSFRIDNWIWRYQVSDSGIWVRCLMQKKYD